MLRRGVPTVLLPVLLPVLLVVALVLGTGSPAAAAPSYLDGVRAATNAERTERGLRPLRGDACLTRVARAQAVRMARARQLSHTTPFGGVLRRCGLRTAGENVAAHPGGPRAVVAAWMGSAAHRANVLGPQYRLLGLGAVRRHGTWWVVQVFGSR